MGDSRKLWIHGPAGRLEAALRETEAPRGAALLAHPHPQFGGTLHNPVVFHADRGLNRAGLTTLRFNYRGVQGSEGSYDDGRGEVGDVASAAAWLRALAPAVPLILVGYSFGARCVVEEAVLDPDVAGLVAIGLPVRLWPFDALASLGRPIAVVQGTQDEFGSIVEVEAVLARTLPRGRLYQISGASHLFPGRAAEVAARVVEAVEAMLD